jgi:hypothetical protein
MRTFLLRTVEGHHVPVPARELWIAFRPPGPGFAVVDGEGDIHFRSGGAEVTITDECFEWQVTIEGDDERAEALAARIGARLAGYADKRIAVVPLSGR